MTTKILIILTLLSVLAVGVGIFALQRVPKYQPPALTTPSSANGIYALIGWDTSPADQTWKNPYITGVVLRTYWRDLNPRPGVYDWSYIDSNIKMANSSGKRVRLMIAPGFYSPDWVLGDSNISTAIFKVPEGPDKGQDKPLPLPWDSTYLADWFNFVDTLAQRYANNPTFSYISATGPNSHNGEISLPRTASDESTWLSQVNGDPNLLQQKLTTAWKATIDKFCTDFAGKHFTLAFISKSYPIGRDPTIEDQYISSLAAYGATKCPATFGIQTNGLDASSQPLPQWDLVGSYAGKIFTGFQTRAPHNLYRRSDKVAIFRQAIIANGLARHPNFLEIYETDINDPSLQLILQQAADILK